MRHLALSYLLWLLTAGSLLGDVSKFLTAPFRGAEELVTNVWHGIRALFIKLRDVFGHLWDAFADFLKGAVALGRALIHFARNVVSAIGWLVETAIPAVGRWALARAVGFAKAAVSTARKYLLKVIQWVRVHAERLVHAVERLAQHLYRVLLRKVTSAWHWITKAGHRVYNLVMHPARLVTWIMPHLVLPLLKFIVAHSEPLVRYLVKRAITVSLSLANVIEDAVASLL